MTDRTGETMHTQVAQATAEEAYGAAHRALRRSGRSLWLAAVSLLLSGATIAAIVALRT